jgi:predicted Zn-dependent peptidase
MLKILLLFFPIFFALPILAASEQFINDPFELLEYLKFENGVEIYLAPSLDANLTAVRVEVDVGYDVETKDNYGVSHLLEHILFRDEKLKEEMSYLQLIKEKGGSANGTTQPRLTSYFASIQAKDGTWLLETITRLILKPSITQEYVENEKRTVELERGKPSPLIQTLGFDPKDYLYPKYLHVKDFWDSEFGVPIEGKFTLAEEQLSTQRLGLATVRQHYDNYYIPSNMRVYVAGKFNKTEIMAVLNSEWQSLEKKIGQKMPPIGKAVPVQHPYEVAALNPERPYISIGTKFWDISQIELLVLDVYIEYVAYRLMKELRNKKGQIYTANGLVSNYADFGFTYVQFETPKENFKDNLKLVKDYLINEAERGELSNFQIAEATELYLKNYLLAGAEADNKMALLSIMKQNFELFQSHASPVKLLKEIKPEEFRAILQKYYKPNQRYGYLYEPPLLFYYDSQLLTAFIFIMTFFFLRRLLTQEFQHDKIRWVRKLEYPPLKVLEFLTGMIALFAFMHLKYVLYVILYTFPLWRSTLFFSSYLGPVLDFIIFLIVMQAFVSFIPKKLMVVDDQLMLKSLSYFSRRISLTEIAKIECVRCVSYPFPLSRWLVSVKFRFYFFSPKIWKKGLLITLKNGDGYYFSMKNAEVAKRELDGFIAPVSVTPNKVEVV